MEFNKDEILDDEILYRIAKRSDPDAFKDGEPQAALFMDKRGASVDRDGGRPEKDIIDKFQWRFRKNNEYRATVRIDAGRCRSAGTFLNPIGNLSNQYHAEIWDSEDVVEVSLLKAMQLASMCKVVSYIE